MTIISSNQTKTNIDSRKLTPSKVHKNTLDDKKDIFNDKQLPNYKPQVIQRQYLNPCNSLAFKLEILINKILGIENQSVNYMSQENGVHICFNSLIISYISLYVL